MEAPHNDVAQGDMQWWQGAFFQGLLLLIILITLFLGKAIFSDRPLLASDLLFQLDPLWQPLAPPGYSGPANQVLSDQAFEFYPWKLYMRTELAQGRLPLWNPYVYSGQPLVADAQSALFDPFNLVGLLWPLTKSFVVVVFLRLLCGGLFMLLLALELGLSRYAAYLAMVVFGFGGPQVVWLLYPKASVLVWLPAILFLSARLIRTGQWRYVAWLALAMAAQLVGGHPETVLYSVLLWLAFCGYWLWLDARVRGASPWRQRSVQLVVAGCLGVGAGAIQWLPVAEALWQSEILSARSQSSFSWQSLFFQWHDWLAALTMTMPDFFGNPRHGDYWNPYSNYTEQTIYVGLIPLALALLVLFSKGKQRQVGFWLVVALISWGLALHLPGFTLLAEAPGLSITNSARLRSIYLLAVAMLAGFGLDLLRQSFLADRDERHSQRTFSTILLTLGIGAALIAAGSYLYLTHFHTQLVELGRAQAAAAQGNPFFFRSSGEYRALAAVRVQQMIASFSAVNWIMYWPLISAVVIIGIMHLLHRRVGAGRRTQLLSIVLVTCTVGELWLFGLDYNPTVALADTYPTPPLVNYLVKSAPTDSEPYRVMGTGLALLPNVSMIFGLEDIRGYDPIAPRRYMELMSRLPGAVRVGHHLLFNDVGASFLDFLNVRYAFAANTFAATGVDGRWRPLQQSGDVTLYANPEAMPRAFMVYNSQSANSPAESLEMTLAPGFNFRNSVVLEGVTAPLVPSAPSNPSPSPPRVTMARAVPGEITVDVESAQPGYLVLSEPYTAGWVAEVDGKEAPILIANHAFRAVPMVQGSHHLTMRYQPLTFVVGAWISAISLLVIILILVFAERISHGEVA